MRSSIRNWSHWTNAIRYTLVSPFPIATTLTQFDLADVLYYDGVTALDLLIERESTYLRVAETLTQILQHVKPDTALLAIKWFNARVSAALGITLSSNMLIGLTMHLACLLDRLLEGPTHTDFPDKERYVQQHDAMISLIRHELIAIEQAFSLAISEDEVCTICRFFISQDISQPTKEVINAYP
ncbi:MULTISPECIES: PRD domain-containing protein [Symbiopectobacterium]|uniref:PRD domain-containing protein n=1 Tax=Symbiopectobacterium TaxID=801 RepID=UPI001A2CDA26|nr:MULTISPECIES: PRD domain-containing protein [Symbiopectobacterium]MBG6247672.1 PRD domain-containing protein [Candidatus Symbiopectobacterium sp. PLON1]MBT9429801.1 PRD domain-containing protein [Candidatus Symbiopectobacterium endolongispinus]